MHKRKTTRFSFLFHFGYILLQKKHIVCVFNFFFLFGPRIFEISTSTVALVIAIHPLQVIFISMIIYSMFCKSLQDVNTFIHYIYISFACLLMGDNEMEIGNEKHKKRNS